MALFSLDLAKTLYPLAPDNTAKDAVLTFTGLIAEATVKQFVKRDLEPTAYDEVYDGNGKPDLPLRQHPVLAPRLAAALTSGGYDVTVASTADLFVGMPVAVFQSTPGTAVPVATTVAEVTDATTFKLSATATATGSYTLSFGPQVCLDPTAFGGSGVNAFAATASWLADGRDFMLVRDDGRDSESGILRRLGGGIQGAAYDWWSDRQRGTLTAKLPPAWNVNWGNIRVLYAAGYRCPPADLAGAVAMLAIWVQRTAPYGGYQTLQSERLGDYSYQLGMALHAEPALGSVRQILTRYREVAI